MKALEGGFHMADYPQRRRVAGRQFVGWRQSVIANRRFESGVDLPEGA